MKKTLLLLLLAFCFTENKAQVLNTAFCQTNGSVYAVAIDSVNNTVYIGGSFTSVCGQPRTRLAAMNLTTGALRPWNPTANNDVRTMYVHKNALYIGGMFTLISGSSRINGAKFYIPSGTLTSWAPAITTPFIVYSIAAKDNKVYLGGSFLLTIGTGQNLCELDTSNASATAWPAALLNGTVYSVAVDGNSLYVGGTYTNIGSSGINYISKFYLGTGVPTLTSWDVLADQFVTSVLPMGDNVYIGGKFAFFNGIPRISIACADSSTAVPTGWDPGCDGQPNKLIYRNGVIYALSNSFSLIGGKARNFIGAVDVTTGVATRWEVFAGSSLYDFATTSSQIYIGGAMNSILGQPRNNFAVVCINPIDTISNAPVGITSVCNGASGVTYSISPVNGATSYVWGYTGTGATIIGTSNSITVNFSAGATSGNLTVQAINNCESSNSLSIPINTYTFTTTVSPITNNIVCGDSVDITSSNNYLGVGSVSYSWVPVAGLNATNVYKVTSGVKTTTAYTLTVTSTEGCVATDNTTITVSPIAITLSSSTPNILCSTKDSLFAINNYAGPGVVTYTWSPAASLNLSNPSKPIANPVVSTNYTLTGSAAGGCLAAPQTIFVTVDPITLTPGASPATIVCGNTSSLSVSDNYPGTGSITYTWSPAGDLSNANIANPVASPTISTVFSVDITTTEGCQSSGNIAILVNALQVFTAGLINTTCGNPVTLSTNNNSGNVNLVYSWSPTGGLSNGTVASPIANVGTTTIFTVTMSLPSTGCASAEAVDTVKISPPAMPAICTVSTDSTSTYNIIYWDKTPYLSTDSFVIYREVTTNTYAQIGVVSHDSTSRFVDNMQLIGPANGNPNIGTYRYKIAVKDFCGNISGKSPYHNTVYFVDNQTGTFTWNLYAVESQTVTPVTQFDLERDNLNNGVWAVVGSVAGTQTTLNDPNYNTYQAIANWRVQALGFNCTPTFRESTGTSAAIIKSKSNITNNRTTGIKNSENTFSVYPNPTNGTLVVSFGNSSTGKTLIKVISMLGEVVYSETVNVVTDKHTVELSKYESGTYIVQITTGNSTITKRIIKN